MGLVYFGARFLNTQLQRWTSADPLEVHTTGRADANFYAYVSGQPLKLVDPLGLSACGGNCEGVAEAYPTGPVVSSQSTAQAAGAAASASSSATSKMMRAGLVIEVVGDEPSSELADLQALTDDELTVVENGTTAESRIRRFTVGIRRSGDGEQPEGTDLVRRLAMGEYRTEVRQSMDSSNTFTTSGPGGYMVNGQPGPGDSQRVRYSRSGGPNHKGFLVVDPDTGVISSQPWQPPIALGHELVHADRGTRGLLKHRPPGGESCAAGMAECGANVYRDERGVSYRQHVPLEELETTGLTGTGDQDVTENDLRRELKLPLRIRY